MRTAKGDRNTHLSSAELVTAFLSNHSDMSCTISGSECLCCCLPPSTSCSTCQHFTQLKPLGCPAALPRALHNTPTSSRPTLPLCWVTRGGAVEGRCLLQLVMRSAVSTSQRLLLFTVAHQVTSGACRLILQRETKTESSAG